MKPSNPKDLIGSNKMPLHMVPATALAHCSLAFLEGSLKYGRTNFRVMGVRASVYIDAAFRHLQLYSEGVDITPDSRLHPLAHAMACCAIILDAEAHGKLIDDRVVSDGLSYQRLLSQLEPLVAQMRQRLKAHRPYQFSIKDRKLLGKVRWSPAACALPDRPIKVRKPKKRRK